MQGRVASAADLPAARRLSWRHSPKSRVHFISKPCPHIASKLLREGEAKEDNQYDAKKRCPTFRPFLPHQ
jgi:hypothetical protein